MKSGNYSLFPLSVLALLAALTFWLESATRSGTTVNNAKSRHDPDFIISDFTLKKLSPQGGLLHVLTASDMRHFPDDDSTDVREPKLTYLGGELPMHLTARSARLSQDGKTAILKDEVFGDRQAGPQSPRMTFATTRLTVLPDDELATTDEFVTLTHGQSKLTGTGMDVDNKTRIVNLRSHVKATIEPRKR